MILDFTAIRPSLPLFVVAVMIIAFPAMAAERSALDLMQASDDLSKLIGDLGDNDTMTRHRATQALCAIGSQAENAVPMLMKMLSDKNCNTQSQLAVVDVLGCIGAPAIPSLIEALGDETRPRALFALAKMGEIAVPPLAEVLKHENPRARWQAAEALGYIGPKAKEALPALAKALEDKDKILRRKSARAMASMGSVAVPAIIDLLDNRSARVRAGAASALQNPCGLWKQSVAALIKTLGDEDVMVRTASADALAEIGPLAKDAVSALTKACEDKDDSVGVAAAKALGRIGPAAEEAVPALCSLLRTQNGEAARLTVVSLGQIGVATEDVVSTLLSVLTKQRTFETSYIFNTFYWFGPQAKEAVPDLVRIMETSQSWADRRDAAMALSWIGPPAEAAVPVLIDILQGNIQIPSGPSRYTGHSMRGAVILALGGIGSASEAAVPLLRDAMRKGGFSHEKELAAEALAKIEHTHTQALKKETSEEVSLTHRAIESAEPLTEHEIVERAAKFYGSGYSERAAFIGALVSTTPSSPDALYTLLRVVNGRDDQFKISAINACVKYTWCPADVEAVLMAATSYREQGIRIAAVCGLAEMGSSAKSALPLLKRISESNEKNIAAAAKEAMRRIESI